MRNFILLMLVLFPTTLFADNALNFEAGVVENPYNRVAVPGDDGTQFDLSKATDESYFYHRLSFVKNWDKHGMRLLYAPLALSGSATYSKNIDFNGVTFNANEKVSARYVFNSYRASYFYQIDDEGPWTTRIGLTAKIRDAQIKLSQGNQSKAKFNTGVVPLFYLFSEYRLSETFRLAFDFDGWAAPQGRAFDFALMAGANLRDNLIFDIGYRMLEGGADNDEVYTFATLQYAFAALTLKF